MLLEGYSYRDMINDESICEGLKVIEADPTRYEASIGTPFVYATKDGKDLHVRILKPQCCDQQEQFPLIIFIQGSAWMKQNLEGSFYNLEPIVLQGYTIAVIEYRDSSIAPFPAQIIDTKTAIRYLCAHSEELGLCTDSVYLMGDSSGGHTALGCWISWNKDLFDAEFEGGKNPLCRLKGIVDFYGPTDLYAMPDQISTMDHNSPLSPEGLEIGGLEIKTHEAKAREASITSYLQEGDGRAPLLIIHGGKDRLVPFRQSFDFYQKLKALHYDCRMIKMNNADHGGSAFYIPAMYEEVFAFLKECR